MKKQYEQMTVTPLRISIDSDILAGSIEDSPAEVKSVTVEDYQESFSVCDFDAITF